MAAGGRARFGAPGANSLQQAALKLLLPEMSWAGRMLVLACAGVLFCGAAAESRTHGRSVTAEEEGVPGGATCEQLRAAQSAAGIAACAGPELRGGELGGLAASNLTWTPAAGQQPGVLAAWMPADALWGVLMRPRDVLLLATDALELVSGASAASLWCRDVDSGPCGVAVPCCVADASETGPMGVSELAHAAVQVVMQATRTMLTVMLGLWLGLRAAAGATVTSWPGCVGFEFCTLSQLGVMRYVGSRAVLGVRVIVCAVSVVGGTAVLAGRQALGGGSKDAHGPG